jgi:hypothetical protein
MGLENSICLCISFKSQVLRSFSCMPRFELSSPAPLLALLRLAMDTPHVEASLAKQVPSLSSHSSADVSQPLGSAKDAMARRAVLLLAARADMMLEYFSIDIQCPPPSHDMDAAGGADAELQRVRVEEDRVLADTVLVALPQLIDGFVPPMLTLPLFLLRLATEVCIMLCFDVCNSNFSVTRDYIHHSVPHASTLMPICAPQVNWTHEQECFASIAHELALFYQVQPGMYWDAQSQSSPASSGASGVMAADRVASSDHVVLIDDDETAAARTSSSSSSSSSASTVAPLQRLSQTQHSIQHTLMPHMRFSFSVPARHAADGAIVQVACLENLYKTFERC